MKVPTALTGCQVWRTAFDYQVRLILIARHPGGGYRVDAELVIGTRFLLCDAAGGNGRNLTRVPVHASPWSSTCS